MFAEAMSALPDPNHFASIGWVCVILVAIIVGVRQGIGLVRDLKEKPSSGEVMTQANATFATKQELERLEAEFKHYREQESIQAALRRKGIYDRLDGSRKEVLESVDKMRGDFDDKIKDVYNRVDTIPDRIIATLRNTGAIK